MILTQGCEYFIPQETLIGALFNYRSDPLTSENGSNKRGNYNMRTKVFPDLLEIYPVMGKRIKIF
jgi:hypothetical protein